MSLRALQPCLSIDCVTCAWQSGVLIYPTGLPRRVYLALSGELKTRLAMT